jgi:hypothetical protein
VFGEWDIGGAFLWLELGEQFLMDFENHIAFAGAEAVAALVAGCGSAALMQTGNAIGARVCVEIRNTPIRRRIWHTWIQ